jgi:Ca2+-binding EF-hand superfamily protein
MNKLSILFAAWCVAAPAAAQDTRAAQAAEKDALFRKLDTNGDGYLSPQELGAQNAQQGNWVAVDRNRDGRISRDEFGIVRNFARATPPAEEPATSAAGGTRAPSPAPATGSAPP